jgi:hypothetical protein
MHPLTGKLPATGWQSRWAPQGSPMISEPDKRIEKNTPTLISSWTPGAAIDYYIARNIQQMVIPAGGLDSLHQYYISYAAMRKLKKGDSAFYITASPYFNLATTNRIADRFESAENVLTIPVYRINLLCKQFFILLLKNYDGQSFE